MSLIRRQQRTILPNQPVPEQRGADDLATDGSPPSSHNNDHMCAVCSEVLTDLLVTSCAYEYSHCYNCGATRTIKPCTTFSSCIGPSQTSTTLDEGVYNHCKPQGRGNVYSWRKIFEQTSSIANASITNTTATNSTTATAAASLPVSDLPLIKQHGNILKSQQQKVVKPPLDRDKLFTAVYTSRPVQPSWEAAGPVAHPYTVSLPCCSTVDYSHHHPLQLSAASEDVGEICPPDDGVSMMVPLPTSDTSTFHSNLSNSCLSFQSQEEFFILIDDNNDENEIGQDMQGPVCQICLDGRVQLVFIPCGHVTCQSCSNQLQLTTECCPFCRTIISDRVELHW